MATLEQLETALVNADKAGDMDAARKLAAAVSEARKDPVNKIPGLSVPGTTKQAPEQTLADKAIGTGEAALSAVTGLTGGAVGGIVGTGAGIAKTIADGTFGTPEGARSAEEAAMNAARAATYQPRTESGQEQGAALGGAMQNLIPLSGIGAELAGLQGALKPAAVQAVQAVKSGSEKVGALAKQAGASVAERIPTRNVPTINEPLPGSMGAAAVNPIEQARALVSKASPELQAAVEETIKRREPLNLPAVENYVEAETLPVPVRMTKGQATGDAVLISEEMNSRGKFPEVVAALDDQNKALIENVNAIKEKVAPDVYLQNPTEHGDVLISAYEKLDNDLQTQVRANYKALEDANGGKFPMNTQAFVRAAEENLTKKNRNHFLPAEVRSIINQYKDGLEMDFNGFEELRTILAGEARKADRAGDGNRATAVGAVRKALEDLPMEQGSEELKALADIARSSAKQRFDLIKSDQAFKSVVDGKALPDGFVNKYVINADSSRLETMLKNLSLVDPKLKQVAASATMNHLKRAAKVDNDVGTFAQNSFNGALGKLGTKAQLLFDQDAATLQQLGRVAQKLKHQPAGSFVNNSNTATALIAEGAKSGIEGLGNAITGAVSFGNVKGGTGVRKLIEARNARKEFSKSFKHGAGVSAKESKLLEVKRKVLEAKAKKQKP